MEPVLNSRVADFLRRYPPFNYLQEETLFTISQRVVIQYKRSGEVIFQQGKPSTGFIYIVKEGAVQLFQQDEKGGSILMDECDEGDVFGLRPLLTKLPYALTSVVREETLLYAIPVDGAEQLIENNPQVASYLATTFALGYQHKSLVPSASSKLFLGNDHTETRFPLVEVQSVEFNPEPVTCTPNITVQEAAIIMSSKRVSSIIVVDDDNHPLGIITDKDFRAKVATGLQPLSAFAGELMSSPVITSPPYLTVADVQIDMVKHRIHHLCITEDGSVNSPVLGVVSEHDLLVIQGNNPAVLVRQIKRGRTARELAQIREKAETLLRKYIYQEVSISFISTVMTEVNDAIMVRAIELATRSMDEEAWPDPGVPYCWMALGSEGRGEQLLRTDQDNALVFADVEAEDYEVVKAYYLELAKRVTKILNDVGFDYCPGDMMASNPKWCQSLSEWKAQFSEWIFQPTSQAILYSSIFFDYRPVYGDSSLTERLTEHIFDKVGNESLFLAYLAKNAVDTPPPLTFFRNFLVERGGEHKNEFDIKLRAMMPLVDAARVLMLGSKVGKVNNTFRRFEKMAELEPQNKELYEQAADAYEMLMRYRALQGLKLSNSGRYFNPEEMTKTERVNLRNAFQPIRDLQALLRLRFQVAYIS